MGWQPRSGKEAQAQERLLGCLREKNSPVLCFPAWRGCLSRPVGEELARLRGVQCWPGVGLRDWSHSAVFQKEQGEEGKTSPDTHWVAAGWPGLLVQQAWCQVVGPSQWSPGTPPLTAQGQGSPTIASWGYQEWSFMEYGIIQYFSRETGYVGQKGDSSPHVLCVIRVY